MKGAPPPASKRGRVSSSVLRNSASPMIRPMMMSWWYSPWPPNILRSSTGPIPANRSDRKTVYSLSTANSTSWHDQHPRSISRHRRQYEHADDTDLQSPAANPFLRIAMGLHRHP